MKTAWLSLFANLLFLNMLEAQMEDKIWLLGGSASSTDSVYMACRMTFEADTNLFYNISNSLPYRRFNASICSPSGKFLCLSNGETIFNKQFAIIKNGENLYPNAEYSQTGFPYGQSFLLLPKPGDSTKAVQINGDFQLVEPPSGPGLADLGLFYSEIDFTKDNGLGEVVIKNKLIAVEDSLAGTSYTAVRHGNGRDWWILAPHYDDTTRYFRFLLSPDGLAKIGEQKINTTQPGIGSSCFSPDGKWFARFNEWGDMPPYESTLDLYNFDRCTGLLSNRITYDYPGGQKPGGVAFSESSRFLYVSVWDSLYQYDLLAPEILGSHVMVAGWDGFVGDFNVGTRFYTLLLAPDKKIYGCVSNGSSRYLHVIEHPDKKGLACEVKQHAIKLPVYNIFCMPNMPYFRLYNWQDSPCDTIGMVATNEPGGLPKMFSIAPNPATNQFQISFGTPLSASGRLSVIDLNGQVMQSISITQGLSSIEVSADGLPEGCYFVHLLGEDGWLEVRKLIIVK